VLGRSSGGNESPSVGLNVGLTVGIVSLLDGANVGLGVPSTLMLVDSFSTGTFPAFSTIP
jgi:hypothetical protein